MRGPRRIAAGLTTATLIAGAFIAPAATARTNEAKSPPDSVVPKLDWKPCDTGFECAQADVPTDYDKPGGKTTTIALIKLPAAKPDQKIGSLFTNPGGPGGSGVDFIKSAGKAAYSQAVRDRFDVIGFDPRAVGASDPATCFANQAEESAFVATLPAFPVTRAEARDFLPKDAAFSRACAERSGERIKHSSTANVARDMDLLRRAVGDKKLSYVGYSYGTYLGATYAKLFPRNIRSLVLDGTIDPASYSGTDGDRRSIGARIGQGPASYETFQQFLKECEKTGDACGLNALGKPSDVVKKTYEQLKTDPVPVDLGDGTTAEVGYPMAVALVFQGMYSADGWTDLAGLLAYLATGGEGKQPATAPKQLKQATPEGEDYPSVGGALASICVDSKPRIKPNEFQRLADAEDRRAPDLGRYRAWTGIECPVVDLQDRDAFRGPWKQSVKQDVLVIGTRFDPATPYKNTRPYTRSFPNGHMLTVEGYGHTILGKSMCADDAVTRYLLEGKTPSKGATCEQDAAPFDPAPAGAKVPTPLMF